MANAHRRTVSKKERKEDFIELAKALRDEGQEGSLVNTISQLTTFSERYTRELLLDEYKQDYTVPDKSELSADSKQKPKRKSKWDTTDKEKLDNLYKKVERSAFTGQKPTSQSLIEAAKGLDLLVESYEIELQKIKACLRDSVDGVRHGMTIVSLDDEFSRREEGNAPSPTWRVKKLRAAHERGEYTWASLEPCPGIWKQDLHKLLEELCFVDLMIIGKLNYDKRSSTIEAREYYQSAVDVFRDFCKDHGIRYYVKSDTLKFIEARAL